MYNKQQLNKVVQFIKSVRLQNLNCKYVCDYILDSECEDETYWDEDIKTLIQDYKVYVNVMEETE